ncbi:MAG: hypothetical protein BGO26_01955 [Actinobacteria bacterium 69-20]|nr:histidine phosphatase family protein [Actinomycetota bacterium]OJV31247.1 MAG: hypothetical protein BGO26_01955 [Actinobacteria bacterium 69-20]
MALDHVIAMRHGETDWNLALRMQGHRDIPLSEVGLAQAKAAAASVGALEPDVIVSSDLQRAHATADVIGRVTGLSVRTDRRLRETSLGEWEGLSRDEVQTRWPDEWERWRHSDARIAPPGGESRVEVAARAQSVVDELDAGSCRTALLVTHGGLIVGLTGRLLGLPDDCWGDLVGVSNCHWVVLHRVVGRWRLHTYNGGLAGIVPPVDEEIADD